MHGNFATVHTPDKLKSLLNRGGNRINPRDLGLLVLCSTYGATPTAYEVKSVRVGDISEVSLQSLPKTMRQIVKVHITSSVHFPPRPPFNVDVTKNGYIANETSSAINATLKRVGGGRDEYSRGKVVQCLYNVFETTLSHSILSKIVYDIETCISILMINSTFNRYSSVSCNFFSIE